MTSHRRSTPLRGALPAAGAAALFALALAALALDAGPSPVHARDGGPPDRAGASADAPSSSGGLDAAPNAAVVRRVRAAADGPVPDLPAPAPPRAAVGHGHGAPPSPDAAPGATAPSPGALASPSPGGASRLDRAGPVAGHDGTAPGPAASPYDPAWASTPPTRVLTHAHDPGSSDAQNGALLAAAAAALLPGDTLRVGPGDYALDAPLRLLQAGTAAAPVVVEAAPGAAPRLYRGDIAARLVEIGGEGAGGARASHVALRGLHLEGGEVAVRLNKASEVWIDGCEMHGGGGGVHATTENVDHAHITRNEIHHTLNYGEGLQLGRNSPNRIFSDSIVALNHIHDTRDALQGEGIDLKWRSNGNWIVQNVIHATKYPSIKFEATDGRPVNVIERNVCFDSSDNLIQAEGGEAIVRNNLLVAPAGNKLFDSSHNSATLRDLVVTHNTMLGANGYGAGLWAWNGQPNLVFANNVVYVKDWSGGTYSIAIGTDQLGGTIEGNVVFGKARNLTWGFTTGAGLSDFAGVPSWAYVFGQVGDLRPSAAGALPAVADPAFAAELDFFGDPRGLPTEPGALVVGD